uniref:Glutaredoxin domain-containing protein n=1 Tax=Plectus sambesii TaxID=2011161 RepID=A0A914UJ04_9BILA
MMENLNVRFDCRDLNLCPAYYDELHNRMGIPVLVTDSNNNRFDTNSVWNSLPMIFVDGEYFGDEQTLNLLNETGELKRIFQPHIVVNNRTVCNKCHGFRFRPCQVCRGGKRSPLRFANLQFRCVKCDDNGIVACQDCTSSV